MSTTPPGRRAASLVALVILTIFGGTGGARTARGADARPSWNPATTWALLVGVLEWKNPGLGSFPQAGRVDRVLEKTLLARGVPRTQLTFLEDAAATLDGCRSALVKTADAVPEGGTLLVYYAGHGVRSKGRTWFMPYDADTSDPGKTAWAVDELADALGTRTKGRTVLLFADCCHSGALDAVVTRLDAAGTAAAACLSSASVASQSTGRWTFTEALVSIFGGGGAADTDEDGFVDFAEADGLVHREMRYREEQWTKGARTAAFPSALRLSTVDPAHPRAARVAGPWQIGDFGQIEWRGSWWPGRVLAVEPAKLRVHYVGYGDRGDQWVEATRFRAVPALPFDADANVRVEWKGAWYPAKVLRVDVEFALVHYDDFDASSDEWVPASRLRAKK